MDLKVKDPTKINGIDDVYPNASALKNEMLYNVFKLADLDSADTEALDKNV